MPDGMRAFEQTPLFQLNLLVWLSWPSAPVVYPVFQAEGFVLDRVGQQITVPLAARLAATRAVPPVAMNQAISPDLLLRHPDRPTLISLECKVDSFGVASSAARQAAGLLACPGPHVAAELGLMEPLRWRVFPLYAVAHPQQNPMAYTLDELRRLLDQASVDAGPDPATALGIEVAADGVYLHFAAPERLPFAVDTAVKVMDLAPGDDPRPLYVIPLDPSIDAADPYGRRALEERVRAAVVATLGARLGRGPATVAWDDLMRLAIPVWSLWRDRGRRRVLQQCKAYVRERLRELAPLGVTFEESQDGFTITEVSPEVAEQVLRRLQTPAAGQRALRLDEPGQMVIGDEPMDDEP